jgi:hypothetical protein
MVRGAKVKFRVTLLDAAGLPLSELLVNDMQLSLYTTTARESIACSIAVGSGITKESQGVYTIEIPETDTVKLENWGVAMLEGWLLPVRRKIAFNLGPVKDNIKNV